MTHPNDSLSPQMLSALVEASEAINSSLELTPTLQRIAEQAARVMNAEASSVLLLDRSRNRLVFKAATGREGQRLIDQTFDADKGIAGKVVQTAEPLLVSDARSEASFFDGIDAESSFTTRTMVAAPLVKGGEVIGVVEVLNRHGEQPFTEDDAELLRIFANLAASGATNAQAHEQLQRENRGLRATQADRLSIIGQSQALNATLKLCDRVAGSNATVLLLGETGTGKEVLSRHIHARSPRSDKAFIAINCAALPETLLESELFGHEKGAFTGATAQKIGRFELADGGTLFLDEIGDISPSIQVKLLRVLQEKEFVRVGGTRTVACDVRIIAATNRDLKTAMEEGHFREDLYYRLNVFPIATPPLRHRREDLPLLVNHFVQISATRLGMATPGLSEEAMALMSRYDWPGNIRELQNIVERAVLLCDEQTIGPHHLPPEIAGEHVERGASPVDTTLPGQEKALILKTLRDHDWNQTRAAAALGISRDNLRYRVKKYKIHRPE